MKTVLATVSLIAVAATLREQALNVRDRREDLRPMRRSSSLRRLA
jgi:hypothetical protein